MTGTEAGAGAIVGTREAGFSVKLNGTGLDGLSDNVGSREEVVNGTAEWLGFVDGSVIGNNSDGEPDGKDFGIVVGVLSNGFTDGLRTAVGVLVGNSVQSDVGDEDETGDLVDTL